MIGNRKHRKRFLHKSAIAIFAASLLIFFILNILFPLPSLKSYSTIVEARDGTVMHAFLSDDDKWRMALKDSELSPILKKAFILKEDRWFYFHTGVNPVALARATVNNFRKGRRTSGASTITMQVARLLKPGPRTYKRKVVEMFRATQLEWKYSKQEILMLYLNLVPYGGNVEGVKAASWIYFGKSPMQLTAAEITALTVIPNRPNSLRIDGDHTELIEMRNKWLRRFEEKGLFTEAEMEDALFEPIEGYRRPAPRMAPHLSNRLVKQFSDNTIIQSSIDLQKQHTAEDITKQYIQSLYHQKITNASVLMVDNKTGEVLSYLGSADFNSADYGGQVDGVRAVRSPGSTLKPFLYAMSFDQGLATANTTVLDVPTGYGTYQPENYDQKFNGRVSVREALARSLNVPAVRLLDELGVYPFIEKLEQAGLRQISKDKSNLGLSVILGGCGVRLEELVQLYTTFANDGELQQLTFLNEASTNTKSLLSASASYMVSDILTEVTRPDLPSNFEYSSQLPKIAWKTGTSYGRRDAWSIGYNQHYTIGVWVGNFDGKGNPALSGAEMASPLLFQLFNALDPQSGKDWFASPEEIDYRMVCSETGLVPSAHCTDKVMDEFIPLVSSGKVCDHLQAVTVDHDQAHSYCTRCQSDTNTEIVWMENIPNELQKFYTQQAVPFEIIPAHNPNCDRLYADESISIVTPIDGLEYYMEEDSEGLQLQVLTTSQVKKAYWYVDGQFYSEMEKSKPIFLKPKEGKQKITCVDEQGRKDDVWINVKFVKM